MDGWQTQWVAASEIEVEPVRSTEVTVLLPAYNEELAIRRVLEEIVEALAGEPLAYEILIVDDASTDRTADLAERFAQDCWQCPVRVIRLPENRGAGAARKVGVREARGEIVVMLDADGSYPAAAIRDLLAHFPNYDQVNGARTSEQGTLPWLRRPAKWFIRRLACYLTGCRIPDLNTGLKAFKRQAMLPWLWVVPDGFSCVTTMTLAFLTNGHAVKYVPTAYRPRIGKSKFHPIKDTLAYLATVLRMVLYFRPLKIFLPLAGLLIAGGALKSIASFASTGSMQESDIVVLTAGFMTAMLGLLAEVIVAHHRR
jgi:glycosyltransferase involved in cell wall biosynthesis